MPPSTRSCAQHIRPASKARKVTTAFSRVGCGMKIRFDRSGMLQWQIGRVFTTLSEGLVEGAERYMSGSHQMIEDADDRAGRRSFALLCSVEVVHMEAMSTSLHTWFSDLSSHNLFRILQSVQAPGHL